MELLGDLYLKVNKVSDEASTTERLMTALISKMEHMDSDLQMLKMENKAMKNILSSPTGFLKKAGFVKIDTPFTEDVMPDGFRGNSDDIFLKGDDISAVIPQSNEEFHAMSWDDIHELAVSAKTNEVVN